MINSPRPEYATPTPIIHCPRTAEDKNEGGSNALMLAITEDPLSRTRSEPGSLSTNAVTRRAVPVFYLDLILCLFLILFG